MPLPDQPLTHPLNYPFRVMAKGGKGDFASREKYLCFSAFAGATYSSAALAVMQTMPRVFKVLMTRLGPEVIRAGFWA